LICLLLVPNRSLWGDQAAKLEAHLQSLVSKSMSGHAGTVVVLDVDSGRVLAQHRLDFAARKLARPGSALKPFTLLALLESGRIAPQSAVVCGRKLRLGGKKLDCMHPRLAEAMNATMALAFSCNYYFAHFAEVVREPDLAKAFARAGLIARTGLAEREAVGFVRRSETLEGRQLLAIGEANIEVTPLALLAAYRKLALQRKQGSELTPSEAAVFAGLEGSISYGTGQLAQPPGAAWRVAGKTGTATATRGSWTHAWFVGYAPAEDPEIVLVVFLERGRGGSQAAAIAREIFAAYQAARGLQ
jgi:cell division protein FtsI/penicillin-binding protein 2